MDPVAAAPCVVECLSRAGVEAVVESLAGLLYDAVQAGVSLGFMADLDLEGARRYWREVATDPGRIVFVARDAEGIAGVVVLVLMAGAFQPHRAVVAKLIVAPRARRHGVGAALMAALEAEAFARGRPVLTLFTRRGSDAEALYRRLGWECVGIIRDDSLRPDGSPCDAAIYRKRLGSPAPPTDRG